jgi:hypothetical protein
MLIRYIWRLAGNVKCSKHLTAVVCTVLLAAPPRPPNIVAYCWEHLHVCVQLFGQLFGKERAT